MPHLIISGAPSTGKSSLIRCLRERYPAVEEQCHFIQDGGRWWLEKYAQECGAVVSVDRLTPQERNRMQEEMYEYYKEGEEVAAAQGKILVADAFLAEMLVYSKDIQNPELLERIESDLAQKRHELLILILPGRQIALENDGVRHCDPSYRQYVEEEIIALYEKYHVRYATAPTAQLDERVQFLAGMLESMRMSMAAA